MIKMADEVLKKSTARILPQLYGNKAVLANLREAVNINDKRAQAVWPFMFTEMDTKYLSRNFEGKPTNAENAIYAALRCYAIHQQGIDECVYAPVNGDSDGLPLFKALAYLRADESMRVALDRRVQSLFSSRQPASVTRGITQLVRILKSNNRNLKIDYSQLAQDLYYFESSFQSAGQICLKWGQQYYREIVKEKDGIEE